MPQNRYVRNSNFSLFLSLSFFLAHEAHYGKTLQLHKNFKWNYCVFAKYSSCKEGYNLLLTEKDGSRYRKKYIKYMIDCRVWHKFFFNIQWVQEPNKTLNGCHITLFSSSTHSLACWTGFVYQKPVFYIPGARKQSIFSLFSPSHHHHPPPFLYFFEAYRHAAAVIQKDTTMIALVYSGGKLKLLRLKIQLIWVIIIVMS